MKTEKDRVTLKIPRPLYDKLGKVIKGGGFRSVNEFVVHVLRDLVSLRGGRASGLTEDEIGLIRKRLENLGYF